MSIEKAYNSWADQYDSNTNKTRDLDAIATKKVLDKYTFSKVIELGCGTGKNTIYLLHKAKAIIGLDFSQEMLHMAEAKVNSDKVEFRRTNLNKPWKVDDHFSDLITCSLTLEHIKNLDFIFAQANKKLKPKGYFFICELHPFKQYAGSKARFESEIGTEILETYTHHISDYISAAKANGFELKEIDEWFDDVNKTGIPRLISFVFLKKQEITKG